MADSTEVANLPPGMDAYAGYVDGWWPDYAGEVAVEHGVPVMSIAVSPGVPAECLDIENGDATPADVPGWLALARPKVPHPVLYASVSAMPDVLGVLQGAGVPRSTVRLWSAHYGDGAHVCGPASCGLVRVPVDGTQWIDHGLWDESLLSAEFFAVPARRSVRQTPPPASSSLPKIGASMNKLLVLATGTAAGGVEPLSWWLIDLSTTRPTRTPVPEAQMGLLNAALGKLGLVTEQPCSSVAGFPLS